MIGSQVKNFLIGLFVIGAVTVFVSLVMFLKPSVGDGKQTIIFRFADINKMGIGTRVNYAGMPVGEIVDITVIKDARDQPVDELGRIYTYQVETNIDSKVKIFDTDKVDIQTSGLLGEKSIGITPMAPPKGVTPKQITTQPIYADSIDPLEHAIVKVSDMASDMEETFELATLWLKKYGDSLGGSVISFGKVMDDVDEAILTLKDKKTFENIGDIAANFKVTTANLSSGQGTLGKLINDDGLYLRFSSIMSKVDLVLNDVNQYGLLFHLNKEWQRTRLKNVTFLNSLDSPQAFRSYFQDEVDSINLSMGRLSLLIQRAEETPEKDIIMDSDSFKKDFRDLLNRVDELSDNLKLFNQELMNPNAD